ncbi:MAG: hypothetical protein MRECE_21c002 [Mycoplasmataceae bacterium CE_OT135]|nr:MAG: hypothetical protein MRECE_21c002 [Mycoplasmataceae bacterium CE_OT135]
MEQEKQSLTEGINLLCAEISKLEKDWQGRLRSIKPRKNEVNIQEKYLDVLARLLTTKKEPCMAVCYDKFKDSLLVAGNRRDLGYARETINYLRELISASSSNWYNRYKELLRLVATEQVKVPAGGDSNQARNRKTTEVKKPLEEEKEKSSKESKIDKFLELVNRCRQTSGGDFSQSEWEEIIHEALEEIKFYDKEEKRKEEWLKYLLPFEDLKIVSEAIRDNKLDSQVVQAIKNDRINYIECENKEYCKGCGKNCRGNLCGKKKYCNSCKHCKEMNLHAEMKIISNLSKETIKSSCYIGISKLACLPCQVTIDTLNEFTHFPLTDYKKAFNVRGTHGSTYDRWIVPSIFPLEKNEELQDKILATFQRIKEEWKSLKLYETTADFPCELSVFSPENTNIGDTKGEEKAVPIFSSEMQTSLSDQEKKDRIKKVIISTRDTFSKTILDRYIAFEEQEDICQRSQEMEIELPIQSIKQQAQTLQPPYGIPGSSKK